MKEMGCSAAKLPLTTAEPSLHIEDTAAGRERELRVPGSCSSRHALREGEGSVQETPCKPGTEHLAISPSGSLGSGRDGV
ncbi:unnamed protein product [Caretta caretta]